MAKGAAGAAAGGLGAGRVVVVVASASSMPVAATIAAHATEAAQSSAALRLAVLRDALCTRCAAAGVVSTATVRDHLDDITLYS